jgi:hypothetical protein
MSNEKSPVGMEQVDDKRLAEIRERESKATKGPWAVWQVSRTIIECEDGSPISSMTLGANYQPHEYQDKLKQMEANAEFSAHARADIPYLLEQIESLRRPTTEQAEVQQDLRMDAYYYSFTATRVPAIDLILSAVACAGKAYHHTDMWREECEWVPHTGNSPVEWIQNAANAAAESLRRSGAQPGKLSEQDCPCAEFGTDGTTNHHGGVTTFRHNGKERTFTACGNHAPNYRGTGFVTEIIESGQAAARRGTE